MSITPSPRSLSVARKTVGSVWSSIRVRRIPHRIVHGATTRTGVWSSVLRHMMRWSSHLWVVLVSWSSRGRCHTHVMARVGSGVCPSRSHDGHHILSPCIPHVSLLALVLVISELYNERTGGSFHDEIIVEALDSLYGRISTDISQEGCTFARPISIADHVDFSNLSKRGKEFSNFVLSSFS